MATKKSTDQDQESPEDTQSKSGNLSPPTGSNSLPEKLPGGSQCRSGETSPGDADPAHSSRGGTPSNRMDRAGSLARKVLAQAGETDLIVPPSELAPEIEFTVGDTHRAQWACCGVPKRYLNQIWGQGWNAVDLRGGAMDTPVHRAKELLDVMTDLGEVERGLLLHGGVGTGKTLIAACTVYEYIIGTPAGWEQPDGSLGPYPVDIASLAAAEKGWRTAFTPPKNCIFASVPDLLSQVRSTFDSAASANGAAMIENWAQCEFLVLDDIGAERVTDWTVELIYQIVNHRYNAKLPTVFTSNHSLNEIASRLSERIADRMLEMCRGRIVHFEAESYRG